MRPAPVPAVPEISLYTAHSASGLRSMLETEAGGAGFPPYWAYPWAGGIALARYLLDTPSVVAGRRILDLGAGSGLVGIAAMLSSAGHVVAAETDLNAHAAIGLNAELNGVALSVTGDDLLPGDPPDVELVLGGDVFYEAGLAERVIAFSDRCVDAGIDVLIGDPGRAHLPGMGLRLVARYDVPDFGMAGTGRGEGYVFAPAPARRGAAS